MSDLKSFDPTRVLDGWRVPTPPAIDLALPQAAASLDLPRPTPPDAIDAAHVLDGWQPPAPAPLDLDLKSVLRAGSTRPDGAKQSWLKARGYEMLDVEDVEVSERPPACSRVEPAERDRLDDMGGVDDQALPPAVEAPALDLHVPVSPSPVDPQQVIDDVRLPDVAPPPAVVEAPVLDFRLPSAPVVRDPRLLARWQPLAWTALARRLRDATTEVVQTPRGPLVETHPPQWLCALWQPQSIDAPLLGRWPELAGVVGADVALDAVQQLLTELQIGRAHV